MTGAALRRRLPGALLLLALSAPSCGVLGGGGGYHLTAFFPRAVALYPQSRVLVMGVDSGIVDEIEIEGQIIRVEMTVNDNVPLPADVRAGIQAVTLVGERNVVLGPPWKPGMERARDGDEIPLDRTDIPVEPDDALQAFTDLANAIEPEQVARLVTSAANSLEGQGPLINNALEQAASLTSTLAEQDQQLLEVAANLHRLASTLNSREQQLGSVIDSFSQAAQVLADERDGIASYLSSLVSLTEQGTSLLAAFGGQLPGDIAILTSLALTLEANVGAIEELIAAFPDITGTLVDAYDPARHLLVLRVTVLPGVISAIRGTLPGLTDGLCDLIPIPIVCV